MSVTVKVIPVPGRAAEVTTEKTRTAIGVAIEAGVNVSKYHRIQIIRNGKEVITALQNGDVIYLHSVVYGD